MEDRKHIYHTIFLLMFMLIPFCALAEPIIGMYGVPSIKSVNPDTYLNNFSEAGVNAVFVPEDEETIRWFKRNGYKVYISMNVFGGTEPWKKYPDARPVKENGELLEEGKGGYGGICPTHEGWRKERLDHMEGILRKFGGKNGIDGIWLDFIRYPGEWEVAAPDVPNTCYCKRCLEKFKAETRNLQPPASSLQPQSQKYEWIKWKKKQIESFVIEAKRIIERFSKERPIKFGLFVVPWTKGEKQNDISFKLAQDAFELSRHVDVISPMVYHKMCGHDETWVGVMTAYYKETALCDVWPIVQSYDCEPKEFAKTLRYAGETGADGILVLSFGGMKPNMWKEMKAFQRPENAIAPGLSPVTPGLLLKTFDQYYMRDEFKKKPMDAVGVSADYGRTGSWEAPLPECKAGQKYLFTGLLYRDKFENGVYADISVWGKKYHINEHLWSGTFQPVRVHITCPENITDSTFKFINSNPGTTFYMAKPELRKVGGQRLESRDKGPVRGQESGVRGKAEDGKMGRWEDGNSGQAESVGRSNHSSPHPLIPSSPIAKNPTNSTNTTNVFPFPIGTYGVHINNLKEIKETGIDTVMIGGKGNDLKKLIEECNRLGLKYILSVPHDPDELLVYLEEMEKAGVRGRLSSTSIPQSPTSNLQAPASSLQPPASNLLGFYVNDEPEIVSFPMNKANDVQRLIKNRFPEAATFMAVVRPQKVRDYLSATDFFMMDQYPVPSRPMVWLSDSIDEAAEITGTERIISIIQAFGGDEEAKHGWPRLPTRQEIECLTFLSIVHGSRGVFFFTFQAIGKTEAGRKDLAHVVGRLNKIKPWLTVNNIEDKVQWVKDSEGQPAVAVDILSFYGTDQKGRPGIQAALKRKENQWLLIAVNVIGMDVEAMIKTNINENGSVEEILNDIKYSVDNGRIYARFKPYEVKVFLKE